MGSKISRHLRDGLRTKDKMESGAYADGTAFCGGDLTCVLGRFGFKPVRFHFPVSLFELWNTGFFEIQKVARRVAVVCTKSGRGGHTLAFVHERFYGDYLIETEDVRCVFLKPQKDV